MLTGVYYILMDVVRCDMRRYECTSGEQTMVIVWLCVPVYSFFVTWRVLVVIHEDKNAYTYIYVHIRTYIHSYRPLPSNKSK